MSAAERAAMSREFEEALTRTGIAPQDFGEALQRTNPACRSAVLVAHLGIPGELFPHRSCGWGLLGNRLGFGGAWAGHVRSLVHVGSCSGLEGPLAMAVVVGVV